MVPTVAPLNFPCSRCGACCRFASRATEEQREGKIRLMPDGTCVHLRSDNICGIYEDRPQVCRVDTLRPLEQDVEVWYRLNLTLCDVLHIAAFGSPRIPMVAQ